MTLNIKTSVSIYDSRVIIFIPSQAGSDHQTFSMTLPYKLRAYYDKVVTPASQAGQTQGGARARLTGTVLENMVHAYTTMNTFLTRSAS